MKKYNSRKQSLVPEFFILRDLDCTLMSAADDKALPCSFYEFATLKDLAEHLMQIAVRNVLCLENKWEVKSTQSV